MSYADKAKTTATATDGDTNQSGQNRCAHATAAIIPHPALRTPTTVASDKNRSGQFAEDFWLEAKKRHCESRTHLRSLLNRYIQPH